MIECLWIETKQQQLIEFTAQVQELLVEHGDLHSGLVTVFIAHTSASLLIQENADPSVQADLIAWLNRLVPEHDPLYTHTAEGPDDMPAHIKSMLTQTSISIPFEHQRLLLGTWQGLYLFEHRRHRQRRKIIVHLA